MQGTRGRVEGLGQPGDTLGTGWGHGDRHTGGWDMGERGRAGTWGHVGTRPRGDTWGQLEVWGWHKGDTGTPRVWDTWGGWPWVQHGDNTGVAQVAPESCVPKHQGHTCALPCVPTVLVSLLSPVTLVPCPVCPHCPAVPCPSMSPCPRVAAVPLCPCVPIPHPLCPLTVPMSPMSPVPLCPHCVPTVSVSPVVSCVPSVPRCPHHGVPMSFQVPSHPPGSVSPPVPCPSVSPCVSDVSPLCL